MLKETLSQGLKISKGRVPVSQPIRTKPWKISQGWVPVSQLTGTLL